MKHAFAVLMLMCLCAKADTLLFETPGSDKPFTQAASVATTVYTYWTDPVPQRLRWNGSTNSAGNADDAGSQSNNLDGIAVGMVQTTLGTMEDGSPNYVYSLDGIDDYLSQPNGYNPNPISPYGDYTNYTLILRFWSTREATNLIDIMASRGKLAEDEAIGINKTYAPYLPTNSLFVSSSVAVTNGAAVLTNTAIHIAYRRKNFGRIDLFTNGVYSLSNVVFNSALTTLNWSNLTIGARSDVSYPLKGYIDEVTIYSLTNLTDAQIMTHYTNINRIRMTP